MDLASASRHTSTAYSLEQPRTRQNTISIVAGTVDLLPQSFELFAQSVYELLSGEGCQIPRRQASQKPNFSDGR
jgi:hypothetical protein